MTMERAVSAVVGVAEHGSSVVLVTTIGDRLLDRRDIHLLEPGLPDHPHHHEGSWAVGRYLGTPGARSVTLADAVRLVERVRLAAERRALEGLHSLRRDLGVPITAIAIRRCPDLPPTTEERIRDHRAQLVADSVMYRRAVESSAMSLGWRVFWYDKQRVHDQAVATVRPESLAATLTAMGRSAGPPWRANHKIAAAAAIAAGAHFAAGAT
jgi:hypothetical protein